MGLYFHVFVTRFPTLLFHKVLVLFCRRHLLDSDNLRWWVVRVQRPLVPGFICERHEVDKEVFVELPVQRPPPGVNQLGTIIIILIRIIIIIISTIIIIISIITIIITINIIIIVTLSLPLIEHHLPRPHD